MPWIKWVIGFILSLLNSEIIFIPDQSNFHLLFHSKGWEFQTFQVFLFAYNSLCWVRYLVNQNHNKRVRAIILLVLEFLTTQYTYFLLQIFWLLVMSNMKLNYIQPYVLKLFQITPRIPRGEQPYHGSGSVASTNNICWMKLQLWLTILLPKGKH